MKIFILDSNKKTLSELEKFFSSKNRFEVVGCADNGIDGLKGINETKPDVVVMDLILNNLDGFGVLKELDTSSVKVVVTTAMCSDEIVSSCFAMGVKYVLIKPYDFEILADRISGIVSAENKEVKEIRGFAPSSISSVSVSAAPAEVGTKSVTTLLRDIGITPNLKGFRYLRLAISMVVENEAVIETVTKVIYPGIAKEFKTTPVRAERAIRHAIETAWERDGGETMKKVFNLPNNIKRPTNSEFIGLAAEYLKA
ncbi:MAG: sporulation transcription factor Spo0A [Clostridiales bacterium]|nr:sporulation transcription factor Spo0A [Clostridiales bacterium]